MHLPSLPHQESTHSPSPGVQVSPGHFHFVQVSAPGAPLQMYPYAHGTPAGTQAPEVLFLVQMPVVDVVPPSQ